MNDRKKILVTNDDGIDARGIRMLVRTLSEAADIYVCAPATEQSATGHGLTMGPGRYIDFIERQIPHTKLNGHAVKRLPGNTNFCFEGIEGESLLLLLDMKGIAASSGSACTSGSLDPSHVLLAIGLPHEVAHGSLRMTLSEYNTMEEVEYVISQLPGIIEYLRDMSPVWEALQKGEKQYVIQ